MNKNNMKFISRNTNYRLTLKHAMPAEPLTGRSSDPGIHVKFVNGTANVNDESVIKMLLASDKYGIDFVSSEDVEVNSDSFTETNGIEPEHDLQQIQYGHVTNSLNPKPLLSGLDKDKKKAIDAMIKEQATKLAIEMAPEMAKKIIRETIKASKDADGEEDVVDQEVEEVSKKPKGLSDKKSVKEAAKEISKIQKDNKKNFTQVAKVEDDGVDMIDDDVPLV